MIYLDKKNNDEEYKSLFAASSFCFNFTSSETFVFSFRSCSSRSRPSDELLMMELNIIDVLFSSGAEDREKKS